MNWKLQEKDLEIILFLETLRSYQIQMESASESESESTSIALRVSQYNSTTPLRISVSTCTSELRLGPAFQSGFHSLKQKEVI